MQLAHLSWHKAEPILKNPDTLVVIPVGSTEQHGPVGPLGTDWLIPEWITKEMEKRCDILVTPVVPFGDYFTLLLYCFQSTTFIPDSGRQLFHGRRKQPAARAREPFDT